MAPFSKSGPGDRPNYSRPNAQSGEFIAPSGAPRLRGTAPREHRQDPPPRTENLAPAKPVPVAAAAVTPELKGSRSGPARNEVKICGLAAVKARFAKNPASIHRLFFDYETGRKIGVISKALAEARKIYRCVEPAELEKVGGTIHHGGIVAVVDAPTLRAPSAEEVKAWARRGEPVLVLDRIGNAHNLGAIARTAAFFGVPQLVIPEDAGAAKPNDAAYRVAEGGLEQLTVWRVPKLTDFLRELAAAGYDVAGAATRGGRPESSIKPKAIALVLGNEEQGLSAEVAAVCTRLVTLTGSGQVESLNVSVAGAVLMWEFFGRKK